MVSTFIPVFQLVYDNDLSAFIPEWWAAEGIEILEENMVAAKLVNRDFQAQLSKFGDIVHTRKPGEFTAKRKVKTDNITKQDVTATDIQVPLDQHVHVSFQIHDEDMSKSFQELLQIYIRPGFLALARNIDRVVLGQYPRFLGNVAGQLGGLAATNVYDYILETRETMNINKAPEEGRSLLWGPRSETVVLKNELFVSAEKVGDSGTALRNASIGHKVGFNHFMCQNTPYINRNGTVDVDASAALTAGFPAGSTSFSIDNATAGDATTGCYFTIEGDMQPLIAAAGSTSVGITSTTGTKYATLNDAVVTIYKWATVNNVSNYASGWSKPIVLDGFTSGKFLQVGQILAHGTGNSRKVYTVVDVVSASGTDQTVLLDRPLEAAMNDGDLVFPGPAGSYNLALLRDALALVVRPLITVPEGTGARSAVRNNESLAVRVTFGYSIEAQAMICTLDFLCGIALLEVLKGAVLLG